MLGPLLRSGSLSEFSSLGAVGKPVFSAAGQLRIAIRRSADQQTADIFAVPKQNDQGDLIDWYAPYPGNIVPWSAATPDERRSAKTVLSDVKSSLGTLSGKFQAEEDNSERKVFGKLLELATQIPGDEHVYLVDGRPVITFWGFHPLNAAPGLDVIRDLDVGDAAATNVSPAPVVATPLPGGQDPITDPVVPVGVVAARPARPWWWLWFLLPLLALLFLFFLLSGLKSCGVDVPLAGWLPRLPFGTDAPRVAVVPPDLAPVIDASGKRVFDASGRPVWTDPDGRRLVVDAEGRPVPVGADGLPLPDPGLAAGPMDEAKPDDGAEPVPPTETTDTAVPPDLPSDEATPDTVPPGEDAASVAEPPADGEMPPGKPPGETPPGETPSAADAPGAGSPAPASPLTIPEQAARSGDTGFLDGPWRSDTGLTDSSGNPLQLGYDFKDGKGTVNLQRTVGDQRSVCSGPASPVMQGGALVITQGQIRCKDGTTFNAPKLVCKMGAGGRANCEGANEDGTTFPVDIKR